jgi:hypothetical protein
MSASLLVDQEGLAAIVLPMLEAWRSLRIRAAELGRQLWPAHARARPVAFSCRSRGRGDHRDILCDRH